VSIDHNSLTTNIISQLREYSASFFTFFPWGNDEVTNDHKVTRKNRNFLVASAECASFGAFSVSLHREMIMNEKLVASVRKGEFFTIINHLFNLDRNSQWKEKEIVKTHHDCVYSYFRFAI
jgi:hypothetical protein